MMQALSRRGRLRHRGRANLGNAHPQTLRTMFNLAKLLAHASHLDEAERLFREALEQCLAIYGVANKETVNSANHLARFLQERGDQAKLEKFVQEFQQLQLQHRME
ncbi:NPHP3, partial [Symbiodinium natans]